MAQEFDHLRAFDAAGMEGKIIVPPSQPGDGREAFPVEGKLQDRCLPPGGPSAHTVRLLTQPAFIEEEDGTALGARFFFISGQRRFFQCAMAASFRSRARPTGRWQLQRSLARMRQTWSGWYLTPLCCSIRRATRWLVHKAVGYPQACGPATRPCSKAAKSSALKRGLRPARPALFSPPIPSLSRIFAHRLTDWRCTPTRRATSACEKPFSSKRAARKRRFSIEWKSLRIVLLLDMPRT